MRAQKSRICVTRIVLARYAPTNDIAHCAVILLSRDICEKAQDITSLPHQSYCGRVSPMGFVNLFFTAMFFKSSSVRVRKSLPSSTMSKVVFVSLPT